jgi:RimJ/RimL family protein N-acetyltransferase
MHSEQRESDADRGDVVLQHEDFVVKEMRLSWEKLAQLWATISKFRTLFSDLTNGDIDNFLRFITTGHSIWLEVYEKGALVGIVSLTNMEKVVDTDAHVIFFDKDLTDKVEICRLITKWTFKKFPLQRITVEVPYFYYSTLRLVRGIGFRDEGEKRNAVLIRGRWANVYILGITRQEAAAL